MLGLIRRSFDNGMANGLAIGGRTYFYEIGRENGDGAITGTVLEDLGYNTARRIGSFRISPTGEITRFPRLKQGQRIRLQFCFEKLKQDDPALLNSYSHGVI